MHVPTDLELVARILLAAALGGLIGLERELRDHPAGLRTHITVAVGSAVFVLAGAYGLEQFVTARNSTDLSVSPDRVASTVVTGIGFLGGGAILKTGATVRGLTTAGSLWVTAAVGLAVGFGSYPVAIAGTLVTLGSLTLLRRPERYVQQRLARDRDTVVFRLREGSDPSGIIGAVAGLDGIVVRSMTVREDGDGISVECALRTDARGGLGPRISPLATRPEVETLDFL